MFKHRCEISLEIVLPDKDVQKIRIAHGAEDVPRQRRRAEDSDDQRMQEAEWGAPLSRDRSPQQRRAARENHCGGTLREHGSAEKKSERNPQELPGSRPLQHLIAMAMDAVRSPAKSMSGLAARENPIMATDVGSISRE